MSKTKKIRRTDLRWQLLVTVSAAALLASAYGASEAADSDRPLLWIELGGQLDGLSDTQETFNPPFMASITQPSLLSALNVQKAPQYSLGAEGKITFQPEDSDWLFSASVRFGRSQADLHHHQQTPNAKVPENITYYFSGQKVGGHLGSKYPHEHVKFVDGQSHQSERHLILDFQAGKDLGLGMFGGRGSSVLSAGVRFAQFNSKSDVALRGEPDLQYPTAPINSIPDALAFKYGQQIHFHDYAGMAHEQRSFQGLGPSLAWTGSMPFAGDVDSGELALDLGANAAVLFGRQKVKGHHQTIVKSYYLNHWDQTGYLPNAIGRFENSSQKFYYTSPGLTAHRTNVVPIHRSRNVAVPNLGGSVGLSYRIENFKVSAGYRADFFFGAIDGGIDTRKEETRGFFGPYASISVGLGD